MLQIMSTVHIQSWLSEVGQVLLNTRRLPSSSFDFRKLDLNSAETAETMHCSYDNQLKSSTTH
uniref:DNA binding protein n=1 Tax=Rhizophora mucronata TaxID=61149 RepID=A0A2P2QCP5_RHIMU